MSTAGTCDLGSGNPQTGKIKYTAHSLPVTVQEVAPDDTGLETCTSGSKTAVGNEVVGNISGEGSGETVTWTIQIDLKAIGRNDVKAGDVVICHWNDLGHLTGFVGTPSITKSGKGILTVVFTTAGNGKGKLLG